MGALLDKAIERFSDLPIDELRSVTLSERRTKVEKRTGAPTTFYSAFPLIGRGSVMRQYFVSHEEVDRLFDAAMRK